MKKDELIYKLIFSNEKEFIILVDEYIDNIYKYEVFIKEIKTILNKSKVSIIKESLEVSLNQVKWSIKVKK